MYVHFTLLLKYIVKFGTSYFYVRSYKRQYFYFYVSHYFPKQQYFDFSNLKQYVARFLWLVTSYHIKSPVIQYAVYINISDSTKCNRNLVSS